MAGIVRVAESPPVSPRASGDFGRTEDPNDFRPPSAAGDAGAESLVEASLDILDAPAAAELGPVPTPLIDDLSAAMPFHLFRFQKL